MNLKKRVIEGGMLAVSVAILTAVTSISGAAPAVAATNASDATKLVEETSNYNATIERKCVDVVKAANGNTANLHGVGVNAQLACAAGSEETTDSRKLSGGVGVEQFIAEISANKTSETKTSEKKTSAANKANVGVDAENAILVAKVRDDQTKEEAVEAIEIEDIPKAEETPKTEKTPKAEAEETQAPGTVASVGVNAENAVVSAATDIADDDTDDAQAVAESTQDESDSEQTEESVELDQAADEKKETKKKKNDVWSNRLMADVNEYLNVRAEANDEAEIIGKLYKGAVAEAQETEGDWTHIVSGNVDGYVKSDYCVTGEEAKTYAQENFEVCATVKAEVLRIRDAADEEGVILDVAKEGEKLSVATDVEETNGWIPVNYADSQIAYVSSQYVTVDYDLTKAVTIEEEQERIRQEEEERAAEEEARKAEELAKEAEEAANRPATQAPATTQAPAVQASYDETALLGAVIQLEAGGEPYEGQVAVGAVVMNRVRSGAFPGSISGVIYQSGQFATAGGVASLAASGVQASCMQAAQEALNGVDNTGGALYFRRAGGIDGLIIGNHVFY